MDRLTLSPDAMAAQYAALGNLDGVSIDLEVTSVCDATCTFCPREFMPDKKRFLSMDVVERLAKELRNHRITGVVLCGIGESTLHPQLDQIVRTLAATGTKIEMTTHGGARMDPRRFETLVDCGLTGFSFSLNAATADTHQKVMKLKDFERTVGNLREVIALRDRSHKHVSIHVSFVVCDANQHEAAAFVEQWREHRAVRIWLHPLNNRNGLLSPNLKPVSMDGLVAAYRDDPQVVVDVFGHLHDDDHLCKIAKAMVFISVDGTMRLCAMDYRRATSYGNLLERSLPDMQRTKVSKYLRGEMNDFCRTCDFCPSGIRRGPHATHVLRVV
jgi:MoaA/NifB/PqqE/SkfB family radical SAM enzyme